MLRRHGRVDRREPSGPVRGGDHPVQPARRVRLPLRRRPRLQHAARLDHAALPQPVRRGVGRSGRRPQADERRHPVGPPAGTQDHHRGRQVRAQLALPGHPLRSVRQAGRRTHPPHVPPDRHQPSEPAGRHADPPVPSAGQPRPAVDRLRFQPVQHPHAVLREHRCHPEVSGGHHHPRDHRELLLGEPHHRRAVRRRVRRHLQRRGPLPGEDRRLGTPPCGADRRRDRGSARVRAVRGRGG